jgi:hypothetical protein
VYSNGSCSQYSKDSGSVASNTHQEQIAKKIPTRLYLRKYGKKKGKRTGKKAETVSNADEKEMEKAHKIAKFFRNIFIDKGRVRFVSNEDFQHFIITLNRVDTTLETQKIFGKISTRVKNHRLTEEVILNEFEDNIHVIKQGGVDKRRSKPKAKQMYSFKKRTK